MFCVAREENLCRPFIQPQNLVKVIFSLVKCSSISQLSSFSDVRDFSTCIYTVLGVFCVRSVATVSWIISALRWFGPGRLLRHFQVVQETIISLIHNHKNDKEVQVFSTVYQISITNSCA